MTREGVRCRALGVSYGGRVVFDGLDLALGCGLYALQGANGAGKSTLLRLLAGAQSLDTGEVWIAGESLMRSPMQARRHLSYVPDEAAVYPFMTGQDLLDFCAWAKNCAIDGDVAGMIGNFGLHPHLATRFDAMSLGTRKKMMICAALTGAPGVLLMDEPGNGLDAPSLECLVTLLRRRSRNAAVLIASHDHDFLQRLDATPLLMSDLVQSGAAS
ncbi:ABC transporter ATP-binding protein [Novacetimonas pomaceti]|uniref:ABC transporter ATP-binding protein n=1 Tax=Novacetimonas pomaceti TaxID=2021998 RepID=UPI001C2CECCB|nr:ATP-binding cassette domain-containing protein [Novacetimonas pomaceti]MBV1834392.1 ATP-binding cassette domain-containing protein [Novacetimonas pomaceti]